MDDCQHTNTVETLGGPFRDGNYLAPVGKVCVDCGHYETYYELDEQGAYA